MLKNHFKIALRSLLKDRNFTALNVFGLSAGLACSLLIFMWVSDEMSFDKFFKNDSRLYRLLEQHTSDGEVYYSHESSGRLSDAVKERYAEVEYASAVAPAEWFPQKTLSTAEKNIKANVQFVDKEYLKIFSFTLLHGSANNVLNDKNSIVISDELAIKLFGTTEDIIGKSLKYEQEVSFIVSGVFEKMPLNSSQQFDFLLSFDYFREIKDWTTYWNNIGPSNFVLLKPGTNIDAFNKKLGDIITVNNGDSSRRVVASKFSDGYLYNYFSNGQSGERIGYVNLFTALAIFILVIACINFMNLSTAKAARRLKEVGIKKVVGATRTQLIIQFLVESFLLTMFSMVIAVTLVLALLPQFNQVTGKSMEFSFTWQLAIAVLAIALVTSLVAGSYPAFYISGFKPLAILKGKLKTSMAELLSRRGLVVFQFALSTILIVSVLVIHRQVQFIRNTDAGYNKENIVRFTAEGNLNTNQDAFLSELQQVPGVVNAGYTYHNLIGRSYSAGLDWPGKDPDRGQFFEIFGISHSFMETMDMRLRSGRKFSKEFGMDSASIIINEAAVEAMNLKEPLGTVVQFQGKNLQIIGVVRNFHFESMHEAIKPSFLHLQKGEGKILARIKQGNQQQTLANIEALYKKYNPGFPFAYHFLDEAYQRQYESETRTATLSGYFAGLAIIISCLGLFGMAVFTAQKRQKEIGIRKVVGASALSITAMLSKEFLKLVGIALLIAFPIAWWMMNDWLQGYAYRISLSSTMFWMTGLMVMAITLISIGFQTVKAAMANPVKSLRSE